MYGSDSQSRSGLSQSPASTPTGISGWPKRIAGDVIAARMRVALVWALPFAIFLLFTVILECFGYFCSKSGTSSKPLWILLFLDVFFHLYRLASA